MITYEEFITNKYKDEPKNIQIKIEDYLEYLDLILKDKEEDHEQKTF